MSGWHGSDKSQKAETSNAQHPTTNIQPLLLKTRSMTISTFLPRSGFYSNRFAKPIARWIKTKWTRLWQVPGWTGGNGSTPFLILKLRLTPPFRLKWHSWYKNARTHGAKRIGNGATNCANGSLHSAGKCATRKTGQNSRAALDPRSALRSLLFEPVIKPLDLRSEPGAHEFAKFVIVIF